MPNIVLKKEELRDVAGYILQPQKGLAVGSKSQQRAPCGSLISSQARTTGSLNAEVVGILILIKPRQQPRSIRTLGGEIRKGFHEVLVIFVPYRVIQIRKRLIYHYDFIDGNVSIKPSSIDEAVSNLRDFIAGQFPLFPTLPATTVLNALVALSPSCRPRSAHTGDRVPKADMHMEPHLRQKLQLHFQRWPTRLSRSLSSLLLPALFEYR